MKIFRLFACLSVSLLISLSSLALAGDLSLDDLVNKLQANQSKIHDMYAETTTQITSNFQSQTSKLSGPQTMVQKGRMWTKGKDKTKVEMISPMKQIIITNGDQMMMINPETGQKVIQDLKKLRESQGMAESSKQMNLEKAKEFFDLSVQKLDASKPGDLDTYVITGVPKKENKFLGKMELYIDTARWVPVKIYMYDSKGKLMSRSEIEYQKGDGGIWAPSKNVSNITTPMGKMDVTMEFNNIKINKGISDNEFKI